MRGLVCSCVLVTAACIVPNPAYQDEAGSTTEEADVDADADSNAADDSDSEGAGSESGEPGECLMHPARPLRITVKRDDVPWDPECPEGAGHTVEIGLGNNAYLPGLARILHPECGECFCPPDASMVEIDMGADVAFADGVALPGCTELSLWTRMGADGCEWAGVLVTLQDSALPAYIASNELTVMPLFFIEGQPLTLGLDDEAPCTDRDVCDDELPPGRYALDVLDQAVVTVDDSPRDIEVALSPGAPPETYVFDNRESSLNLECAPQVSWTAQLRPPL